MLLKKQLGKKKTQNKTFSWLEPRQPTPRNISFWVFLDCWLFITKLMWFSPASVKITLSPFLKIISTHLSFMSAEPWYSRWVTLKTLSKKYIKAKIFSFTSLYWQHSSHILAWLNLSFWVKFVVQKVFLNQANKTDV